MEYDSRIGPPTGVSGEGYESELPEQGTDLWGSHVTYGTGVGRYVERRVRVAMDRFLRDRQQNRGEQR